MKTIAGIFILSICFLCSCIGSSTNFTNRSVTYQLTPSIDGKANTITETPKVNDATVNAEKTTETKANVTTGDSQLTDNAAE